MFDSDDNDDFDSPNINLGQLISETVSSRGNVVVDKKQYKHTYKEENGSAKSCQINNGSLTEETKVTNETGPYPGDIVDDSPPLENSGFRKLDFPNPAVLIAFYNEAFLSGRMSFYDWQLEYFEELIAAKASASSPFKSVLQTCNGSGKDFIIIAGFAIWFALCKIKSRTIITSSSGVQLTSQTETYIKDLALLVNEKHGGEVFRIRQRYIKCLLTGSEIRMFATDEKGKAEGYHPWGIGEMAIIVNEGKTVSDEIHNALKRCTGYNYWLEISSTGETSGFFYKAACEWTHVRRVTAYQCKHISPQEIESDKRDLGENSPLFRSIYLALFTSLSGETIISESVINEILEIASISGIPDYPTFRLQIGIDLAAGGDENSITFIKGSKCLKEVQFRETDTEITASRIDSILNNEKVAKDYKFIFADDGGVGRAIIDKLIAKGWAINRVLNQWPAISKKIYGNRGAENWYRVSRILQEHFFDVSTLSIKTREQLFTRHYKQKLGGGRLYLESKQEAKSHGRPSPDRADSFILSMTGITIDDFINATTITPGDIRPKTKFQNMNDIYTHYEDNVTFGRWSEKEVVKIGRGKRIYNSLRRVMADSENNY